MAPAQDDTHLNASCDWLVEVSLVLSGSITSMCHASFRPFACLDFGWGKKNRSIFFCSDLHM